MSRGKSLQELADSNGKKIREQTSKYATNGPNGKKGTATWEWAGAEDVLAAIVAVTDDGCALTFGITSDGGALVVNVLDNGHPAKRYAADTAELNEKLAEITELAHT
jgi:hypothetical protein